LLTCYNKPLGRHLAQLCADQPNLDVMHFHKLCKDTIDEAGRISERDLITEAKSTYPGKDLWKHYFPIALAYALDVVDKRYDAIVVDEGQDFEEEFWLPVECMLEDATSSPLYVFEDENQNLYKRVSTFPIPEAPFPLTTNCRNTKNIHEVAYQHYKGDPIEAPNIEGRSVETIIANGIDGQARKIRNYVSRLLVDEKVSPRAITVLIANRLQKKRYQDALKRYALSGGGTWGSLDDDSSKTVFIETVARFKGLESEVLVLWGLDQLPYEDSREDLYVGSSRAKSILVLCGTAETCEAILKA
jgi:superfamily I DNA/RNA helicase